jgi:hypothetical protein
MQGVEQVAAAERGGDRQREPLGKAASDQRLPPSSMSGRLAPQISFCRRAMSVSPGQVSIGSNAAASGTATRSVSMSSGSAMTTGPGRPLVAT